MGQPHLQPGSAVLVSAIISVYFIASSLAFVRTRAFASPVSRMFERVWTSPQLELWVWKMPLARLRNPLGSSLSILEWPFPLQRRKRGSKW